MTKYTQSSIIFKRIEEMGKLINEIKMNHLKLNIKLCLIKSKRYLRLFLVAIEVLNESLDGSLDGMTSVIVFLLHGRRVKTGLNTRRLFVKTELYPTLLIEAVLANDRHGTL